MLRARDTPLKDYGKIEYILLVDVNFNIYMQHYK